MALVSLIDSDRLVFHSIAGPAGPGGRRIHSVRWCGSGRFPAGGFLHPASPARNPAQPWALTPAARRGAANALL